MWVAASSILNPPAIPDRCDANVNGDSQPAVIPSASVRDKVALWECQATGAVGNSTRTQPDQPQAPDERQHAAADPPAPVDPDGDIRLDKVNI